MKKCIYFILMVFTLPLVGQNDQKTIKVLGEVEKTVIGNKYIVAISLQQIMADAYRNAESKSLSEQQELFAIELKKRNIDFNKFKQNVSYEFSVAYSEKRETAYYQFITRSEDDVRKLQKVVLSGFNVISIEVAADRLNYGQLAALSIEAIDDARKKARAIAEKMGKSIGDIFNVTDLNTKAQRVNTYGYPLKQVHSVTVVFELK